MINVLKVYFLFCFIFFGTLQLASQYQELPNVKLDWIRNHTELTAPGSDEAQLIGTDCMGNIYVIGSSQRGLESNTSVLVKYSNSGDELFRKDLGPEKISTLDLDSEGNIYITNINEVREYEKYCLVKYNTTGEKEWSIESETNDFITDEEGNIYTTSWAKKYYGGWGWWTSSIVGIIVTKYSGAASIVWTDTVCYDTTRIIPYNAQNKIAVDGQGNIIVSFYNTITKLDSNATSLWTKQDTLFQILDLRIDKENNIYFLTIPSILPELPNDIKYSLTKLLPSGEINWTYEFGNIIHLETEDVLWIKLQIDKWNSCYVAASLDDLTLIIDKIDEQGSWQWNYSLSSTDLYEKYFLTTPDGDSFVSTGGMSVYHINVYQVTSSGMCVWTKKINASDSWSYSTSLSGGICCNTNGYVTLACTQRENRNGNWLTIQLDTDGNIIWDAVYNYQGRTNDYVYDLVLDNYGNVYITGRSESYDKRYFEDEESAHWGHHWDFVTVKYSKDGDLIWSTRDSADAHEGDYYRNMYLAMSPDGKPVVCGANLYSINEHGILTIKYSSTGEPLWEVPYEVEHDFQPEGIVIDSDQSIYIVGTKRFWSTKYINPVVDWTLIKISPYGILEWIKEFPENHNVDLNKYYAKCIDIDSNGDIVMGAMISGNGNYSGIKILKYSSSGNLKWNTQIDKPDYELHDLKIGRNNCVYLSAMNGYPNIYYETIMLDPNGILQWSSNHTGTCTIERPMVIDTDGNVFVTGCSTVKYDMAGNEKWFLRDLEGDAIALDKNNDVYIVRGNQVMKYSSSGTIIWEFEIPTTPEKNYIQSRKIKVDNDFNVYVTGNSYIDKSDTTGIVFTTIKLVQDITGIKDGTTQNPIQFKLIQNYPNPFNPKTVISYQLPITNAIELGIYNILGQKVAILVSEKQSAGTYQVEWDATGVANGVYFYRLNTSSGFVQTRKLLVIK